MFEQYSRPPFKIKNQMQGTELFQRVLTYKQHEVCSAYNKKEGVHLNNQERVEKYKKENCSKCKNRKEFECDIRVFQSKDAICTKCINYEREN